MTPSRASVAVLVLGLARVGPAAAQGELAAEVSVERPRDFGWRVGDVLALGASVRVPAGLDLDPRTLEGRSLPEWLEVLASGWMASEGDGWRTYRLRFEYQLFRVPGGVEVLEIPSVPLVFRAPGGDRSVEAAIPAFAFTVSPLTDSTTAAAPDWVPAPPSTGRLRGGGAALALLLAAWGGVALAGRRGRRAGPLWRARRRIAREADCGAAMLVLHRALEERAGRAVFGHDLEALLGRWPAAAAARAELEEFFSLSRARFFDGGPAPLPPPDGGPVPPLGEAECRRRLERLATRLAELDRRTADAPE